MRQSEGSDWEFWKVSANCRKLGKMENLMSNVVRLGEAVREGIPTIRKIIDGKVEEYVDYDRLTPIQIDRLAAHHDCEAVTFKLLSSEQHQGS